MLDRRPPSCLWNCGTRAAIFSRHGRSRWRQHSFRPRLSCLLTGGSASTLWAPYTTRRLLHIRPSAVQPSPSSCSAQFLAMASAQPSPPGRSVHCDVKTLHHPRPAEAPTTATTRFSARNGGQPRPKGEKDPACCRRRVRGGGLARPRRRSWLFARPGPCSRGSSTTRRSLSTIHA